MIFPSLKEALDRYAREVGFDLWGIAPASEFVELEYFPRWVSEGSAGEMKYLEARNEQGELKRAALKHVVPWARSVVICALNYNSAPLNSIAADDPDRAWISRYAWFRQVDYHDAMLDRLRRLEALLKADAPAPVQSRCYVDTGPVIERVFAKYAGIGWLGKNTCLINEHLGSWLFLGVMITDAELTAASRPPAADRCGSCTRCIEACPTSAITAPYQMDARLCISYLTIEKRGDIPIELRPLMGKQVFGCDICQDVCPWNGAVTGVKPPVTSAPEFQPVPELVDPDLEWLGRLTRDEFNHVFRNTPIKRAKYDGLRRNIAVAMGNSGRRKFLPLLQILAEDANQSVAEHARWAIARLSEP